MQVNSAKKIIRKCKKNISKVYSKLARRLIMKSYIPNWCIVLPVLIAGAVIFISCVASHVQASTLNRELLTKETELKELIADNNALTMTVAEQAEAIELVETANDSLTANQQQLEAELAEVYGLKQKYDILVSDMTETQKFLIDYVDNGGNIEDIGIWKCTAYCTEKRPHICGTGTGITSSGEPVQADVSVAVNRSNLSKLPYGTKIYIEGVGVRTIHDTGGGVSGQQFDCATTTHEYALRWPGQGNHRAWILK